jgi:hypothetical protein
MDDLFDFATYPHIPGDKGGTDTGIAAALDMAKKAPVIRNKVVAVLANAGPMGRTPEEACEELGMDRVSVQPRFSELKALGKIAKSHQRRPNPSSGKLAVVWVLPQYVQQAGGGAMSFDTQRAAALALLHKGERLSRKAGSFLGQISVDPTPLTPAQREWLDTLLERAGLPPLAESGVS